MKNIVHAPSWLRFLTLLALLEVCFVIILGSWTRLADAGLGCPDWPGCYGFLGVPQSAEDIVKAEALFPDAPVEYFKGLMEMVHRYFATALGAMILVIAVGAWFHKNTLYFPFKHTQCLLALVILQGAFGAWTVTWKLWPQVVTAHLFGGFITASMLALLFIRLNRMGRSIRSLELKSKRFNLLVFAVIGLLFTIGQIFLGGWMSSNYAALSCATLPDCNGQWWPAMDFQQGFNLLQDKGPNYLGGLMDGEARRTIHVMHRLGAVVLGVYLLVFAGLLARQPDSRLRVFAVLILSVFIVQFGLGLANIFWSLPLAVAVAHNFVGALLFMVMMIITYVLFSKRTRVNQNP